MILVDEPQTWNSRFVNYCHMWSSLTDTDPDAALVELHAFAERLGLKREYFQQTRGISGDFPHYDLHPSKRVMAIRMGAKFVRLTEWIKERRSNVDR